MKNKLFKCGLAVLATFGLTASYAFALPLGGALQNELDKRTMGGPSSIDVTTDMQNDSFDSAWQITASNQSAATLMFELAGFAANTSFGVYDIADASKVVELFDGAASGGNLSSFATLRQLGTTFWEASDLGAAQSFASSSFGYYLDVPDQNTRYYSDTSLNSDQYDHMFAYQGVNDQFSIFNDGIYKPWSPNEWILSWEDLLNGGDQDFTDFVVMVESVNSIPEPATMVLFGTGLAGLAGVARRKKK